MTITIQQIRNRIGDPPEAGVPSTFSDDDITLAIEVAEAILQEQKKVPTTGTLGEEAIRNQVSIRLKNDLIARQGVSSMSEQGNSATFRDPETTVAGWQKDLDDYVNSKRKSPLSVL
jgi:hypothetical protein